MKKMMVSLTVLVAVMFLVGCVNYKGSANEDKSAEEINLINEIAEIERQLDSVGVSEETVGENSAADSAVKENVKELEAPVEEQVVEEQQVAEEKVAVEENVEEVALPELEVAQDETAAVQTITVKENEFVKLKVKVSDPDQDRVSYTFSKPLDNLGQWKTNYGDAGEYIITMKATDGKLTSEKKIKVVVLRVNMPPIIESLKDLIVKEGDEVKLEPVVSDPNKDPVSVKISEPLSNGFFSTDHTSAGEYQIKITASDGELETVKTFKLIVNDVNVLPEIINLKDINVKEGETVKITPDVTDLDGDKITLTISEPVGSDGFWQTSYTTHGVYNVSVSAFDGKDKVTKSVRVNVADVNMPPIIEEVTLMVS